MHQDRSCYCFHMVRVEVAVGWCGLDVEVVQRARSRGRGRSWERKLVGHQRAGAAGDGAGERRVAGLAEVDVVAGAVGRHQRSGIAPLLTARSKSANQVGAATSST
jgi:hypothetical protein